MCDNPIYLEPTSLLMGFLYELPDVRPPRISGRQKADCGYPPSFARSLNCRTCFRLHRTKEIEYTKDRKDTQAECPFLLSMIRKKHKCEFAPYTSSKSRICVWSFL